MEAAVASKATKKAVPGNMHIDARVIEVTKIKSWVKIDIHGLKGCLERRQVPLTRARALRLLEQTKQVNMSKVSLLTFFTSECRQAERVNG